MSNDENLRLALRWSFRYVESPLGDRSWWVQWEVFDSSGNKVMASDGPFAMLTDAIEDAKQHGYVEPEQRSS
jgi:hypothetical protein